MTVYQHLLLALMPTQGPSVTQRSPWRRLWGRSVYTPRSPSRKAYRAIPGAPKSDTAAVSLEAADPEAQNSENSPAAAKANTVVTMAALTICLPPIDQLISLLPAFSMRASRWFFCHFRQPGSSRT